MAKEGDDWIETEEVDESSEDLSIQEYDLTSTPNDFNIRTIVDFLNRGTFVIPQFQRNYVWDVRRASKLIESLVMGLPVPQIFLYEQGRNKFLVVDGQQRLLSIYYFYVKRFPKVEKRGALRRIVDERGQIPAEILGADEYFDHFSLKLPTKLPTQRSRFDGRNYDTLGEDQATFDLRTIRCVVIKQNRPDNDDSSVYEIFNRLNTGGVNLTPQEIRTSLYHSAFYRMLYRLNANTDWRAMVGLQDSDLRMRDVEVLLRGFAMLLRGGDYSPSMTRFLNAFSKTMMKAPDAEIEQLETIFKSFLAATRNLPKGVFGTRSRKMSVSVFESVFAAACSPIFSKQVSEVAVLSEAKISQLRSDDEFIDASSSKSTDTKNVEVRLRKARQVILGE